MTEYRRARVGGGTYFFTVALADRRSSLLVDHVDLLRASFRQIQARHPFMTDAIVVLPDHLHCIWTLPVDDAAFGMRWSLIKSGFSRGFGDGEARSLSREKRSERGIWQRRFWEHLIRDEDDFRRHVDYIHFNPVKHGHASRAVDWPHSSIHRFVREGLCPSDWAAEASVQALEIE